MMGRRDRGPRRTAKKKFCQQCQRRTTFLFDHGLGMFICSEHELEDSEGRR